jgi:hypothetical protein
MAFEFRPQPQPRPRVEFPRLWWIGKKPEPGENQTITYLRVLARPEWLAVHWDESVSPPRSRGCEGSECPPNWHALKAIDTGFAPSVLPVKDGKTGKQRGRRKVLEVKWFQAEIFEPLLVGLPPYLIVVETKKPIDGLVQHAVRLAQANDEKYFAPAEPIFDILPTLRLVWSIPEPAEGKPAFNLRPAERPGERDLADGFPGPEPVDNRSARQILVEAARDGRLGGGKN